MELGKKVNINIQDTQDTHVDVNILLGKSYQYNELLDQLKTQQKLFDRTPEDETDERLAISKKINDLTDLVEQFKKDVLALAETFTKIEINTDRLRRAKEFFDKGEFGEARAVLETELEQMQDEQAHLLKKKEDYETDTLPKLINNSEEFYLLAMATQTDYGNPNRFEDTCKYFEYSIESFAHKFNVFNYASFLSEHKQYSSAKKYYSQCFNNNSFQYTQEELATLFINFANLLTEEHDYEQAFQEYNKALEILEKLAEQNPEVHMYNVASTLNNLAILFTNQNKYVAAFEKYTQALKMSETLANEFPKKYLPMVAMIRNNLANLYSRQHRPQEAQLNLKQVLETYRSLAAEEPELHQFYLASVLNNLGVANKDLRNYEEAASQYAEAYSIYKILAKDNPQRYLPYYAEIINNFASLKAIMTQIDEAAEMFDETIELYRHLTKTNFEIYFPQLARSLTNTAMFYQTYFLNRQKSITYALEAMRILIPYMEKIPSTQPSFANAWRALSKWGLNDEEIEQLIEEKMKEIKENKS